MNTIAIVADPDETGYRATSGNRYSTGRTMGEALDALAAQLDAAETGSLVLIQKRVPDQFFSAAQHARMEELRGRRGSLTPEERAELEDLVNAELDATIARTDALVRQLGK